MEMLIMGLVLFLGLHSVRMFAPNWRANMLDMLGENGYKAAYSVASAIGLALIIWGYSVARQNSPVIWTPPLALKHMAGLLTLAAFIGVAAAYVPRNHIRAAVGHPMLAGTALWALAHLLSKGTLAALLTFGGFFVWALADFLSCRSRDRADGRVIAPGTASGTALTVALGAAAWAVMAFWLHGVWLGYRPYGV